MKVLQTLKGSVTDGERTQRNFLGNSVEKLDVSNGYLSLMLKMPSSSKDSFKGLLQVHVSLFIQFT